MGQEEVKKSEEAPLRLALEQLTKNGITVFLGVSGRWHLQIFPFDHVADQTCSWIDAFREAALKKWARSEERCLRNDMYWRCAQSIR